MKTFLTVQGAKVATTMAMLLALTGNLAAYETKYTDKKVDEKTENNTDFKVDGVIFAGYEKTDTENSGVPDGNGTNARTQGFDVSRAYLNIRGDVVDGDYKGFGFRVTFDGGQVMGGSGATTAVNGNNIHVPEVKYAYMNAPLYSAGSLGSGSVRLGMQHVPMVDGQAGISMESYWKHRYITQSATETLGLSGSSDMGVGYMHKSDYFGLHLLFANGEGFRKLNAQGVTPPGTVALGASTLATASTANAALVRSSLRNLSAGLNANGTSDSYGKDLYGSLAFRPTGKSKDVDFAISLPFRLQNVSGIRDEEVNITTIESIGTPAAKTMALRGDKRARKDKTVGAQGDLNLDLGDLKFGLGLGRAEYTDRRSDAVAFDGTGVVPIGGDTTKYYNPDGDAHGFSNYGYLHAKFKWIGVLYRDMFGSGSTGVLNSASALPSKSYIQQLYEADVQDGRIGNLGSVPTRGSAPLVDLGKARFRNQIVALEFFPMSRLTVSIGMSRLTSTDKDGSRTKVSGLSQIQATGASTIASSNTVENALASVVSSQNTTELAGPIQATDFAGERKENKQYFVRAQYEF
ncbi:MAG: hypothetical protein K8S54_01090 [Spirochaetia bacterium]|nr:hypothetical protein [Spirochaetia bacterium]